MGILGRVGGVAAAASNVPLTLFNALPVFIILAMVGFGMIMLRDFIIVTSPFIASHAKEIQILVNITLKLLEVVMIELGVLINVVMSAIAALSGSSSRFEKPTFVDISVNSDDIVTFTTEMSTTCSTYDNLDMIVLQTTKSMMSPFVCPIIRETYPVQEIWRIAVTLFGWMSFDSAPYPFGGDCQQSGNVDFLCVGFGTGYVVIELLIPAYLLILVLSTGFLTRTISLVFELLKESVSSTARIINSTI